MFKTRVISDNGLQQASEGVSIDVRLPWYRALPLSTVEIAEVRIDGAVAPSETMKFWVNGQSMSLDSLPDRDKEWWYVLDSGYVEIPGQPMPLGSEHEVSVTIGLRPPYIRGFYRMTECTKRLIVRPSDQGGK